MSIATPEVYTEMLKRAKEGKFAYPAINVTSSQTLTAALQGFAEAESDGIIQVSVGGAEYWSGSTVKDRVAGSLAMAAYAREVAKNYNVTVALHTDHCTKDKLASWTEALMDLEIEEVKAGRLPFYQSHMFDGSSVPLAENLETAKRLLPKAVASKTVLEVEIGVVGGEEDGVVGEINEKLYTTTEDGIKTVEALGLGEKGHYLTALTFGNVHGVYKPGHVKLRPELLGTIQEEVGAHFNAGNRPFDLVMHGGSGSTKEEIGVLKVDGEVGNKKQYDPRSWGKAAEAGMAARVVEACQRLGSTGTKMK